MDEKVRFADSLFNPKPIKRPRQLDPLPEDVHPEEIIYFFPAGHALVRVADRDTASNG